MHISEKGEDYELKTVEPSDAGTQGSERGGCGR